MTWTYPAIQHDIKTFIISWCFSVSPVAEEIFFYLRKNNIWIYLRQFVNKIGEPRVLIITAEDINPKKYRILSDILAKKYVKSNNPVDLVKLYLNLIVSGTLSYQENGSEISLSLKSTPRVESNIKGLISDFGLEIILLFNAILLKRGILVYHHDINKLQEKLLAMVHLVPMRNPIEYMYPLVENIQDLKGISFYLAGITTEPSVGKKNYELYVNLVSNEITISNEAKKHFTMTKMHKDLAHIMVDLSKSDLNEAKVIEEIKSKTMDILEQLNSIATCEIGNKKNVVPAGFKVEEY